YILYNLHLTLDHFLFSPDFSSWMGDQSFEQLDRNPFIFRDLLVMKLPLILFDFLAGFLIILISPQTKKRLAGAIWFFNPFSLYAIYQFGQFDIIVSFLILLSVYL